VRAHRPAALRGLRARARARLPRPPAACLRTRAAAAHRRRRAHARARRPLRHPVARALAPNDPDSSLRALFGLRAADPPHDGLPGPRAHARCPDDLRRPRSHAVLRRPPRRQLRRRVGHAPVPRARPRRLRKLLLPRGHHAHRAAPRVGQEARAAAGARELDEQCARLESHGRLPRRANVGDAGLLREDGHGAQAHGDPLGHAERDAHVRRRLRVPGRSRVDESPRLLRGQRRRLPGDGEGVRERALRRDAARADVPHGRRAAQEGRGQGRVSRDRTARDVALPHEDRRGRGARLRAGYGAQGLHGGGDRAARGVARRARRVARRRCHLQEPLLAPRERGARSRADLRARRPERRGRPAHGLRV